MGNCFGRSSSGNFKGEGRTLGSSGAAGSGRNNTSAGDAAPRPNRSSVPAQAPVIPAPSGTGDGFNPDLTPSTGNARSAAARAAEERAAKEKATGQKGGRLAQNLATQKAKTNEAILRDGADEARRQREIDQGTETLQHS